MTNIVDLTEYIKEDEYYKKWDKKMEQFSDIMEEIGTGEPIGVIEGCLKFLHKNRVFNYKLKYSKHTYQFLILIIRGSLDKIQTTESRKCFEYYLENFQRLDKLYGEELKEIYKMYFETIKIKKYKGDKK